MIARSMRAAGWTYALHGRQGKLLRWDVNSAAAHQVAGLAPGWMGVTPGTACR